MPSLARSSDRPEARCLRDFAHTRGLHFGNGPFIQLLFPSYFGKHAAQHARALIGFTRLSSLSQSNLGALMQNGTAVGSLDDIGDLSERSTPNSFATSAASSRRTDLKADIARGRRTPSTGLAAARTGSSARSAVWVAMGVPCAHGAWRKRAGADSRGRSVAFFLAV